MATLGISTNTRLLGLAIITEEGLGLHKVYFHKSPWSPSKANLIISSLEPCVRQYSIKRVVLSIPPLHHQTSAFLYLLHALKVYFGTLGITTNEKCVSELYSLCLESGVRTKKEIMKAVTGHFPEMTTFYEREIRSKNRYYIKLFEAIGVALLSLTK
jgi:hypothetical protein